MKKLKILYGIQCTGNGHLSRSTEIIKFLENNYKDKIESIDVCLSGDFSQIDSSKLNVVYKFKGLGFYMLDGKISIIKTLLNLNLVDFFKSVFSVKLDKYDIIVSDFEPVTCWSALIRRRIVIGIGNHYKFLSNKRFLNNLTPNYYSNKIMTKLISPVHKHITFDFLKEDQNQFFPIIRSELRNKRPTNGEFYISYLSSIPLDKQIKFFTFFPKEEFLIYHNEVTENSDFENIKLRKIDKSDFTKELIRCKGVICHTGFQLTSESLFLGKKLLVIPIKNQIEQIYNTKTLSKFGVINSSDLDITIFDDFFQNDYSVKLNYINEMKLICDKILIYNK